MSAGTVKASSYPRSPIASSLVGPAAAGVGAVKAKGRDRAASPPTTYLQRVYQFFF